MTDLYGTSETWAKEYLAKIIETDCSWNRRSRKDGIKRGLDQIEKEDPHLARVALGMREFYVMKGLPENEIDLHMLGFIRGYRTLRDALELNK